jgi:hypothetical protein
MPVYAFRQGKITQYVDFPNKDAAIAYFRAQLDDEKAKKEKIEDNKTAIDISDEV